MASNHVELKIRGSKRFWVLTISGALGLALALTALWTQAGLALGRQAAAPGGGKGLANAAETAGTFFCYVEVLTADRPSAYGYIAPRGCVPSGEFKRGERIVWRFEIIDLATGNRLTDKEAANVQLRLPYGEQVEADFKQRGEGRVPDAPWTWDACWDTPLDHPLGTLDYSILITTKDGRSGEWKPPALIDPARGIDSRIRIVE